MIRGTTPDFILEIPGWDLTDKTVFVTLSQGVRKITKSNDELDIRWVDVTPEGPDDPDHQTEIGFSLTQQDTLMLTVGGGEIQVRFIDENGEAEATDIQPVSISRVLLEGVIHYAGT